MAATRRCSYSRTSSASSPLVGRWPEGPEGLSSPFMGRCRRSRGRGRAGGALLPIHGEVARRAGGALLPIHGEVARRAGGARASRKLCRVQTLTSADPLVVAGV